MPAYLIATRPSGFRLTQAARDFTDVLEMAHWWQTAGFISSDATWQIRIAPSHPALNAILDAERKCESE